MPPLRNIRVVKGVNYTEYKGQLADAPYSAAPTIQNVRLQESTTVNDAIRFAAEIKGFNFVRSVVR